MIVGSNCPARGAPRHVTRCEARCLATMPPGRVMTQKQPDVGSILSPGDATVSGGTAAGASDIMRSRLLMLTLVVVVIVLLPALLPAFHVTLFGYVGLATLVALGLVLLTGIS